MGDDPYPETEDVHSSRIEDYGPMRMASLYCCGLRPNQFEKNQAWLEEDQAQPEVGYPACAETNSGIPKLRCLWMSSKPIPL